MQKIFVIAVFCIAGIVSQAQQTKRVLFLGNSYTNANNLPQLVSDIASSQGDSLIFDSNTPGGYTMSGHSTNSVSQNKIAQGGWDYVVVQEQSQLPAFPPTQFMSQSFPYSVTLCNQIRSADSCAIPMFFMTWGRKNGDLANCPNYPPLCTYIGMQGKLRERYLFMGDSNNTAVAPVGAVWREIRASNSNIELYSPDESHPSIEGSYLAACTFYASIFHKSAVGASIPGFIDPLAAQAIQQKADEIVFDSLNVWMIDTLTPHTEFTSMIHAVGDSVLFDASLSLNLDSTYWHFGDGTFGTGMQTSHKYQAFGTYNVILEGWRGCLVDSFSYAITLGNPWDVDEYLFGVKIYPNPTSNAIRIEQHNQPLSNAQIKVFSILGKLMLEERNEFEIDVSHLSKGVYFLEVTVDQKVNRIKFVKH